MISRKDAFFGIHFDLHANERDTELGADVTEAMIARLLERVKPDYVQQDCKGHAGYTSYPTKVGWPSPGIIKDALAIWRKVTREHDVKLFIHYSGVWDRVAVEHHPEWARVTSEGKPDPQGITSTFGPYVDELLIPQLKEVFGTYDLDGAWIDGECWATQPDYSPAALAAWKAATGYEDAPRSPDEPHWHEWLEFNRQQFETYLTHYLDALHTFNPALEITSNWMYTAFTPR
ncbi:MAG: alpha-L-fucosidase, partial [Anaerolineae bacterium]